MISSEDQAYRKAHSGHESLIQAEVGGVIATNDPELIDLYKNAVSTDMSVNCIEDVSQKYQGKAEGIGAMTPQNGTIIDLFVTTPSVIMSVDTKIDEYVSTRSPDETPKPSSKPAADTSSSSISTPKKSCCCKVCRKRTIFVGTPNSTMKEKCGLGEPKPC